MKKSPEADLCRDFIATLDKKSWTAYAETGGFDILLVRKSDGLQIGVQAKTQFNVKLLCQILKSTELRKHNGPEYLAVLVPKYQRDHAALCDYLGLGYLPQKTSRSKCSLKGYFDRLCGDIHRGDLPQWHTERVPLPEFVPDVVAGASGPTKLTPWKIKALRLCVILQTQGFVTSDDFRKLQIDRRLWIASKWLRLRSKGYYVADKQPPFLSKHKVVFGKLLKEHKKLSLQANG